MTAQEFGARLKAGEFKNIAGVRRSLSRHKIEGSERARCEADALAYFGAAAPAAAAEPRQRIPRKQKAAAAPAAAATESTDPAPKPRQARTRKDITSKNNVGTTHNSYEFLNSATIRTEIARNAITTLVSAREVVGDALVRDAILAQAHLLQQQARSLARDLGVDEPTNALITPASASSIGNSHPLLGFGNHPLPVG